MSTYTAMIKLGRIVTKDVLYNVDALPEGSFIFQRGSWELLPNAPVCINHDRNRPIGIVRSLMEFEDIDGTWLMAHTTIDEPPCWLERGTAASITYSAYKHYPLGKADRIMAAFIPEVSVLAPSLRPAEPRAKVWSYRRDEPQPIVQATREWKTPSEQRIADLGARGIICRPGIGQVIGIR